MQDKGITDPHPKRQFIQDLIQKLTEKQSARHHIILGIDANEAIEQTGVPVSKHSITKLKRECGLTDVFKYQHGIIII